MILGSVLCDRSRGSPCHRSGIKYVLPPVVHLTRHAEAALDDACDIASCSVAFGDI